jgi:hypothetical protein
VNKAEYAKARRGLVRVALAFIQYRSETSKYVALDELVPKAVWECSVLFELSLEDRERLVVDVSAELIKGFKDFLKNPDE